MSIFQVGVRVTVVFGEKAGRSGVVNGVIKQDGIGLIEVQLDDDAEGPRWFRASVLTREVTKACV